LTPTVPPEPPVLLITDRRMAARPLPDVVAAAMDGGCRWVLVREKDLDTESLTSLVRDIARLARACDATVSVSGDTVTATAAGAHGVHLPQAATGQTAIAAARAALGPGALIGVSTHSIGEARAATEDGADYVTLSPIFLTASKPDYGPALGLGGLADAVARIPIPVLALAGIDATNAGACRRAGASGVAIMGSIMRAADPAGVMAATISAWRARAPRLSVGAKL